jgi:hypothetical protein
VDGEAVHSLLGLLDEEAFKKALRRVVGGSLGEIRACWGAEPVLARACNLWRDGDRIGQN